MQRNYKKAFTALKKMGCPVIEGDDYGDMNKFRICAESNMKARWADYYCQEWGLFGVSNKINRVLDANGLYAEWINPGMIAVVEV